MEAAIDIMFVNEKISEYINPISAGGGGQFDPPPVGLKPGVNTNCLSP